MSSTQLEQIRLLHIDIERFQKIIAFELRNRAKSVSSFLGPEEKWAGVKKNRMKSNFLIYLFFDFFSKNSRSTRITTSIISS